MLIPQTADTPSQAIPFQLLAMEEVAGAAPDNESLLLDIAARLVHLGKSTSATQTSSSKALFQRASAYGLRALELRFPDIREQLREKPEQAVATTTLADVPALFWSGVALGWTYMSDRTETATKAQLATVQALLGRVMELNAGFKQREIFAMFRNLGIERSVSAPGMPAIELVEGAENPDKAPPPRNNHE